MSAPKLFISYCWSSEEHQNWVINLGTALRENGVDVILDKWDLKEGNDANAFMEKMVSDEEVKKVIMIIDEHYSEKANKRKGGVGTEAQIISAEVYASVNQNKFVAVIASNNSEGLPKTPVFYKSRIYIDLSNEDLYNQNFEQLLRWIFDKPLYTKPEIGKMPAFLDEEIALSIGTSGAFRRVIDAMKNAKPFAQGALNEYFSLFAKNIEKFRLEPSKGAQDFDEKVIESIELFIPARNELVEVFTVIAQYDLSMRSSATIHKFFESLIPYINRPESVNSYHTWDWDNLKFIVQENFLLCISVFLKHERYDLVEHLLKCAYYDEKDENYGRSTMRPYGIFRCYLKSLEERNNRLALRRLSVHADLLAVRCSNSEISFNHLMQADFLLYIRDALQAYKDNRHRYWHPTALVFISFDSGAFEIFLRSESEAYFNRIAPLLGVKSKSELTPFIEAVRNGKIQEPGTGFNKLSSLTLMNYEELCRDK